ncbi:helix-turn-helix transcriptional regulator [Streptomyces smyrnaeus]|uniref:helix-turn-helix transcriptional regulator n=1 Tax=Streptomyces smyrnaeus TaxID=1387713 RepID=UPI0036B94FC8
MTAARLKLLAALPTGLREEAERRAAVFHLDAPGWYREPEQTPYLPLFVDPVITQCAVHVRHRRWRAPQEVRRRLRPYGLVLKSSVWYFVAAGKNRIATYRVTQALDAVLSDERFDRPQDFDLGAYWTLLPRPFPDTPLHRQSHCPPVPTGTPAPARQCPSGGGAGSRLHRDRRWDERWVEAVIPTESIEHACGELLRLGSHAEVVAPTELRQAMADTVGVLAEAYGSADVVQAVGSLTSNIK